MLETFIAQQNTWEIVESSRGDVDMLETFMAQQNAWEIVESSRGNVDSMVS